MSFFCTDKNKMLDGETCGSRIFVRITSFLFFIISLIWYHIMLSHTIITANKKKKKK
jgi:hypothetical protein